MIVRPIADTKRMSLIWKAKKGKPKAAEFPEIEALGIAFADSPDPMWIYDLQTLRFLEVNDAAVRCYGYSRRQFLNMTVLEIRPSEEIVTFLHDWQHPQERGGERRRHVGRDGKVLPVSITSRVLTFRGRKAEVVLAKCDETDAAGNPRF